MGLLTPGSKGQITLTLVPIGGGGACLHRSLHNIPEGRQSQVQGTCKAASDIPCKQGALGAFKGIWPG